MDKIPQIKIILGSSSPARREILERLGYELEVMSADINEKAIRHDDPTIMVSAIAYAKAEALLPLISERAILITADSVVLYNGNVREKPRSEKEALEFLESYALAPVDVLSAVVVVNTVSKKRAQAILSSRVYFKSSIADIAGVYSKSNNSLRAAGAFVLDDPAIAPYIDRVEGSRENVMGIDGTLVQKLINQVV